MRSHEVKVELSSLLLRVRSHKLLSTRTKYCQRQDVSMSSSSPMRASGDGNDSAATTQNYLFIGKHSFRLTFCIFLHRCIVWLKRRTVMLRLCLATEAASVAPPLAARSRSFGRATIERFLMLLWRCLRLFLWSSPSPPLRFINRAEGVIATGSCIHVRSSRWNRWQLMTGTLGNRKLRNRHFCNGVVHIIKWAGVIKVATLFMIQIGRAHV